MTARRHDLISVVTGDRREDEWPGGRAGRLDRRRDRRAPPRGHLEPGRSGRPSASCGGARRTRLLDTLKGSGSDAVEVFAGEHYERQLMRSSRPGSAGCGEERAQPLRRSSRPAGLPGGPLAAEGSRRSGGLPPATGQQAPLRRGAPDGRSRCAATKARRAARHPAATVKGPAAAAGLAGRWSPWRALAAGAWLRVATTRAGPPPLPPSPAARAPHETALRPSPRCGEEVPASSADRALLPGALGDRPALHRGTVRPAGAGTHDRGVHPRGDRLRAARRRPPEPRAGLPGPERPRQVRPPPAPPRGHGGGVRRRRAARETPPPALIPGRNKAVP